MMSQIYEIKQISSSMILATLITNISFSATKNLYPIYLKSHVTYNPWHQLDSGMVKMNQDVMSNRHSKWFLNIFLRTFIMNIDCKRMLTNMENSTDNYNGHLHKIMIPQVIQQIFCELLIGGRKLWTVMCFFQSLISGQIFKIILQSLKGYFTKWCLRNPLRDKINVTLMVTAKENYALCLHL